MWTLKPPTSKPETVFTSASDSDTFSLGQQLASQIPNGSLVAFFGDLGAGKTTLIKGLVSAFAEIPPSEIQSPTYTYLHIYPGSSTVHHFDLYRMKDVYEFLSKGLDEFLECDGITCIEWAERITGLLPLGCIRIGIQKTGEESRSISVQGLGV